MPVRSSSLVAGLGMTLLLIGALTACATPAASTPSATAGAGDATSTEIEMDAAWLDGGRIVGLITQGSSTCVPTAGDVTLSATGVLEVGFVEPAADSICTRDMVSRVTLVALPDGIDPSQDLEIAVTGEGYHGDTDLDGVAGLAAPAEEGTPSASWVGDDELVLLTWGSGSRACYPVAESVVVEGAVVTLTVATPAEDQVCTADFGPQGTLVFVDGAVDDTAYELTLTGHGFDGVTVPVIGTP